MEYEIKFRADADARGKILDAYPQNQTHYKMKTTYFDTPTQTLSSRKWTLRQRMENGVAVCTLKTPGAGNARGEWEVPCDNIESALEKLCEKGAPAELISFAGEGLTPICGAEFHRIAVDVIFGESRLELAVDEGVLTGGGKTAPISEVEVEWKSGSIREADAFAAKLAEEFGLKEEKMSKFRRALELCQGE